MSMGRMDTFMDIIEVENIKDKELLTKETERIMNIIYGRNN